MIPTAQTMRSRAGTPEDHSNPPSQKNEAQDKKKGEPKQSLAMDISSFAAHTKNSSNYYASDNEEDNLGDEVLTSAALQSKIGNLALTFPNSMQNHSVHYKRIN